jgi:hypothetical protein
LALFPHISDPLVSYTDIMLIYHWLYWINVGNLYIHSVNTSNLTDVLDILLHIYLVCQTTTYILRNSVLIHNIANFSVSNFTKLQTICVLLLTFETTNFLSKNAIWRVMFKIKITSTGSFNKTKKSFRHKLSGFIV